MKLCLRLSLSLLLASGLLSAHADVNSWHIVDTHRATHRQGWAVGKNRRGYAFLHTRDGGRHWENTSVPGFPSTNNDASNDSLDVDFIGFSARSAVVAFADASHITVAVTEDQGKRWSLSRCKGYTDNRVVLAFPSRRCGYLLAVSDPASGHEGKTISRTQDGGRTWKTVAVDYGQIYGQMSREQPKRLARLPQIPGTNLPDIPNVISNAGFPEGMVFRTCSEGWITGSPRADQNVFLYHTRDGGKTWRMQDLVFPGYYRGGEGGGYADTTPPSFFGPSMREGRLVAEVHSGDLPGGGYRTGRVTYDTHDGGQSWHAARHASRSNPPHRL